jgi:hypothetical protein
MEPMLLAAPYIAEKPNPGFIPGAIIVTPLRGFFPAETFQRLHTEYCSFEHCRLRTANRLL